MSVLSKIIIRKIDRVNYAKAKIPVSELKARISDNNGPLDFRSAIKRGDGRIKLIAEIKKTSPSSGIIRKDFDLLEIARTYKAKNVDAVSIITEEDFFSGDLNYIPSVRQVITNPLLRKDFIIDEYQLYESRACGADAILLIAALLDAVQLEEYLQLSRELGLSVLLEVHDTRELEKALCVKAEIIGINNRDLKTMTINLETTFLLKKDIPPGRIIVSESGINTRADVRRLEDAGIDAMLIGTSLMASRDISKKIDEFRTD